MNVISPHGKQYHSHAATIYKWAQEDAAKGKAAETGHTRLFMQGGRELMRNGLKL